MGSFLAVVSAGAVLAGCVTVRPTKVVDANDIGRAAPRRLSSQPRVVSHPLLAYATSLEPESDEPAEPTPGEPAIHLVDLASLTTWRAALAEYERLDSMELTTEAANYLAQLYYHLDELVAAVPVEAADYPEAVCRTSRHIGSEVMVLRALSEVRRRAGGDATKLYASLRSRQSLKTARDDIDCSTPDVAVFRVMFSYRGAVNGAQLRVAERMRSFGAGTRMDIIRAQMPLSAEPEIRGLRAEVAAALPGSLELANLDELITARCDAEITDEDDDAPACSPTTVESLANLVKVRAKALGAKHPDVASARVHYGRMLLASAEPTQRALGEKQLVKVRTDAAAGSMARLVATADLISALRARQDTARALVLERAFVEELASPTADRNVTLVGETAATIATIAMADHRDDDAYAVLKALMKSFAATPLDACGSQQCDVRPAQIQILQGHARIQSVRALEIEQRVEEIEASIEASQRAR